MNWLAYQGDTLCAEGVPLPELAREFGTPCYVYSADRILQNVRRLREAVAKLPVKLFYAVKANSNGAILRLMAEQGLGAEVVSGGELIRARRAGFPPERIIFTGAGKTAEELELALSEGILCVVVESLGELELLATLARKHGRCGSLALRLNPALDPHTHPHLATGKAGTKFGLDPSQVEQAFDFIAGNPYLCLLGLHVHLGSQIASVEPYVQALGQLVQLAERARRRNLSLWFLDLGGGFSVAYQGGEAFPFAQLAEAVRSKLPGGLTLFLEPGRALVADAGVLLTRVVDRKTVYNRTFVVVDAGMNDFLRPALYSACHRILSVEKGEGPPETVDVVGPVCENADVLGRNVVLPRLCRGKYLALLDVGAYGFSMASHYNSRPRPAEVLLIQGTPVLVRARERMEDLWRGEVEAHVGEDLGQLHSGGPSSKS